MQQSKAYVIKSATRNPKATIAKRKAEYVAYRYGAPNARKITLAHACVLAQGQHNGH